MAYRVVIVDDSQNTVRSLEYGFDWEALGLEVAATACDGIEGKAVIEREKPEIVITDISMPFLDGLGMAESVLEKNPNCRVIVITGYDKFQYASRAIKLSVFDYILKPIDDDELQTALLRAVKSIQREKNAESEAEAALKGRLTLALMAGQDETVCSAVPEFCGADSFCTILVACTEGGLSRPFLQRAEDSVRRSGARTLSVVLEEKLIFLCAAKTCTERERLIGLGRELAREERQLRFGISREHRGSDNLSEMYLEAYGDLLERSARRRVLPGKQGNESGIGDLRKEAETLAEAAEGMAAYERILETFRRCTGESVISLQLMAMLYCSRLLERHGQWGSFLEPVVCDLVQNASPEMFARWLKSFLCAIDQARENSRGRSKLVSDVLRYVELHTLKNIRLEQAAAAFYVSPNYLSALIRRETGITFQQHVMQNKMAVARQLLDDTRMRVEEIAYTVGYENYVSFYQAFKRSEGITPSDYRLRKRE